MPLPSLIQTTDTFNTWFDATNNLISSLSNTSTYVLVDGPPSTGNIAVNGTIKTATFVANGNVSLGGTSLETGVLRITTNSTFNTLTFSGANLSISVTNTVMSGTDFTVSPNTEFKGATVLVGSAATFTKNVTVTTATATGFVSITSNATISTFGAVSNALLIIANSTGSNTTLTTNIWTINVASAITVNASNVYMSSVNNMVLSQATLRANIAGADAFILNSTGAVINTSSTVVGNANFNYAVTLGGPLAINASFVQTADSFLSGLSPAADPFPVSANATIYRVGAVDAAPNKVVPGILNLTPGVYRQLTVFNIGNVAFSFGHANATYGANAIFCPANTNFHVPGHGMCFLYYDTAISRWRVIGSVGDANTTMTGSVNTGTQSFSGTKTFANSVTFNSSMTALQQSYLSNVIENASISAAAATGTINLDVSTAPVSYYTLASTGNWTLNLRGNSSTTLNSLLAVGQSLTCTFLSTQGGSAYYASTVQVDGSTQTVKWQNGVAPATAVSTSSVDAYTFVVVKTAATPTYTIFGAVTKFA